MVLILPDLLGVHTVATYIIDFILRFRIPREQMRDSAMLQFSRGAIHTLPINCNYLPSSERKHYIKTGFVLQEADCELWAEHPPVLLRGQERDSPGLRHWVAPLQQEQGRYRKTQNLLRHFWVFWVHRTPLPQGFAVSKSEEGEKSIAPFCVCEPTW